MNEIDRTKLDSLSARFLVEVTREFPNQDFDVRFTDRLEVVFPACHPAVGDIHVWLDGNEVTVGIGLLYHTHFEADLEGEMSNGEAETHAVADALAFIRDFLNGDTIVHVVLRGNHPIAAAVCRPQEKAFPSYVTAVGGWNFLARLFRRDKRIKSFKWCGPV